MRIINTFFIFSTGLFLACGGEEKIENNEDNTNDTSNEVLVEESIEEEFVENRLTILPAPSMELFSGTYTVSETIAEIQSSYDDSQKLKVVLSEEEELFLEISFGDDPPEEMFKLEIGDMNPFNVFIDLKIADVNQDDVEDELVIWWETGDGRNGVEDGYETQRKGLIIFDIMQRIAMLDFCFEDSYRTYSAGDNADTEDENYHAKMAEDSYWETCSFSHNVTLSSGIISISASEVEKENSSDCSPVLYEAGEYEFNIGSGKFELNL